MTIDFAGSRSTEVLGYELEGLLHRGERNVLHRARQQPGGREVIVKRAIDPGSSGRARALRRERELLRSLRGVAGVVQLADPELQRDDVLLLEDCGASSLDRNGLCGAVTPRDALELSLSLAAALGGIHRRHVLHRDLNPGNILVHSDGCRVSLIDFQSASSLRTGSLQSALASSGLERSLAYIAPEQTGRVRRPADLRADLYALGVTLFELTTGSLPFYAHDARELIHAQIARRPPFPGDLNAEIPQRLSLLILRLLAKNPEDRFASAAQVQQELETCREELVAPVSVALDLRAERGSLPPAKPLVYGRESPLGSLTSALDLACSQGAHVVCIEGEAGIGKSALTREIALPLLARRGASCQSKFESALAAIPYSAVSSALSDLVHQLLTLSPEEHASLQRELAAKLGSAGTALRTLCPDMALLLPDVVAGALPDDERGGQLQHALGTLLRTVARNDRPLCLVLEDIQWADADSVALLVGAMSLVRDARLLLLLTARVGGDLPAEPGVVVALRAAQWQVERIALEPLVEQPFRQLVHDFFEGRRETEQVASLLFASSGGNPLHALAALRALDESGALDADAYDEHVVRQLLSGSQITELLLARFTKLPAPTRHLLQVCACLGSSFALDQLAALQGASAGELLWPALQADLIVPASPIYTASELADPSLELRCLFAHDRIHQAILSTIDGLSRAEIDLRIARALVQQLEGSSQRFTAAVHYNRARALLAPGPELQRVAQLNAGAAREALARAAVTDALAFARAGLSCLHQEHPQPLRNDLLLLAGEAAATVEPEAAVELAGQLLGGVSSARERAQALRVLGRAKQRQSGVSKAIDCYAAALAELDVRLPATVNASVVGDELRRTAEVVHCRAFDAVLSLPSCGEAHALLAMELLNRIVFLSYAAAHPLFAIAVCLMVRRSIEHGIAPESANAYVFYGSLLSREHDLERAYMFGQLALVVAERFDRRDVMAQTFLYANYQLAHWKTPLSELVEPLRIAYQYGLEAGSPFNAACSAATLSICRFWTGEPLVGLQTDLEDARKEIARLGESMPLNWHEVLLQSVLDLRASHLPERTLGGPVYDESTRRAEHHMRNDHGALFNLDVARTLLSYLFGDRAEALAACERNVRYRSTIGSAMWALPTLWLEALCRLAAMDDASDEERSRQLALVTVSLDRLRAWVGFNPSSIEPKLAMIEAELLRVSGSGASALPAYERAVLLARQHGNVLEEAVASELAARFALAHRTLSAAARTHLRTAQRAYWRWGALAKVQQLETQHASILLPTASPLTQLASASSGRPEQLDSLDMMSLLEASRAISREISSEGVLNKLVRLLTQAAGARFACLVFADGDGYTVRARHFVDHNEIVLAPLPLEDMDSPGAVQVLVPYVARTGQAVVLGDPNRTSSLDRDPRLSALASGSAICLPLKRQREVVGFAYLENALARGVFAESHLGIVELLSSQALISLDHARIYEDLDAQVRSRTVELQTKNAELEAALERLVRMQQQLVMQEKLAALGALTAGVAHEIKNPLNLVMNFARLAGELADELEFKLLGGVDQESTARNSLESLTQDLRHSLRKIDEHGARATATVNGMAWHARGGGGGREFVDLNGVVVQSSQIVRSAMTNADSRWLAIDLDLEPGVRPVEIVLSDINRVILNLLTNAQYAVLERRRSSGPDYRPLITLRTRDLGEAVELRVRDNGEGVSDSLRDKIFLPFFTTKPPGQGTGLGLSISHDIVVQGHGGSLSVESELGQYAEFVMVIPRR